MTVLIDSWGWIEYFKGSSPGRKVQEFVEGDAQILISAINVAEIYKHFLQSYSEEQAKQAIDFVLQRSFVIDVNTNIALRSAQVKVKKKMGLADAIVLVTAGKVPIVTGDSDFKNEKNVIYLGK